MATRLEQRIHFLTVRKRANRGPSARAAVPIRKPALLNAGATRFPIAFGPIIGSNPLDSGERVGDASSSLFANIRDRAKLPTRKKLPLRLALPYARETPGRRRAMPRRAGECCRDFSSHSATLYERRRPHWVATSVGPKNRCLGAGIETPYLFPFFVAVIDGF